MGRLGRILRLVLAIVLLTGAMDVHAQSKVQERKTPANIPIALSKEIHRLASDIPAERVLAAINIGNMREKAAPAVPSLLRLLDDQEPVTMKRTMPGSPSVTVESTTTPHKEAKAALVKIGKAAIPLLVSTIPSLDHSGRSALAGALKELAEERSWDEFDVVEPAIALLKGSESSKYNYKSFVLDALIRRAQDPRVIEPLIAALEDSESLYRAKTAEALGFTNDFRAIGPLIACLRDKETLVRDLAMEALGRLVEPDTPRSTRSADEWQRWWNENKDKYVKKHMP
jgi:HEAT repeat protein